MFLNLYNNAFYAVIEKGKPQIPKGEHESPQTKYEPTVTDNKIDSPLQRADVEIRISDNGNGIPQKYLDKIFQPFFTTKPTGRRNRLRFIVELRHYQISRR